MISVIICTFNRAEKLRLTLESLRHMSIPADLRWELIVVDNNSSDPIEKAIESFATNSLFRIRYLLEKRQGLSYARNTGVSEASGEIIAFTDDDVRVHPDWISRIQSTFDHFDCVAIGGRILPIWLGNKPSWLVTNGPDRLMSVIPHFDFGLAPFKLTWPPFGANMAFKKAVFEKYGLFRTDLGRSGKKLLGGDDTEFCRRLINGHENLIYAPSAIVYHPVDKETAAKRYFQSWYFNYGRSVVRVENVPADIARCFGIPRYLFREMVDSCLKWVVDLDAQRRFYHKLHAYQAAGQIWESFRCSERYKSGGHSKQGKA